jgi:cytochrome b involved in lipid metabolism
MNGKTISILALVILLGVGTYVFLTDNQNQEPITSTENGAGGEVATTTGSTGNNSGGASTATGYTLAMVATHKNASSCWTAIDGKVYDLTKWINQHPGGTEAILSICGKDGTAAFHTQHEGQSEPAERLAGFQIGTLQ